MTPSLFQIRAEIGRPVISHVVAPSLHEAHRPFHKTSRDEATGENAQHTRYAKHEYLAAYSRRQRRTKTAAESEHHLIRHE